jgi:hypothetical protein
MPVTSSLRAIAFLSASMLLISQPTAQAQGTDGIQTIGVKSCGDYLDQRQKLDKQSFHGSFAQIMDWWVSGILTGYNLAESRRGVEQFDYRTLMESSTNISYLDKYCRDHPLGNTFNGALCLLHALNPGVTSIAPKGC